MSQARAAADVVSIVLPTHNGARYIEQSLDSCVAQTHHNWELIVVDDDSTDETPGILGRYAGGRVRVVRHAASRGLSAALNTGFALARGEFLTWTSDDNYYRPAALERMLAFLYGHPDVAFVYTDSQWVDSVGTPTYSCVVEAPERLLYTNVVGPCFLYRRRVYEAVGRYAEDIPLAEDYDYWLRVSLRFRMAALHEDLYCYRRHEQALTHRHSPEAIRAAMCKALARHIRAIPWVDAEAKAAVCINEARRARFERHLARMVHYLTLGFLLDPAWAARYVTARLIGRSAL